MSQEALQDLDEIDDFIARRSENPSGADVVQRYLFQAFERIGADPSRCRGKPWPHVTRLRVKFLTVRKYVIIYDDSTNPVGIVAVVGARQDLAQLLNTDKRFAKLVRGS